MIVFKEVCVGCGRCQPYCPARAIFFEDQRSAVDQTLCLECGTCLRSGICPVDALFEPPQVYEYPRALRKYFSDPTSTHSVTGIQGRGTEESKTNDVTMRCGPGAVGIAIEIGRPTLGMGLRDIQKITRALAQAGINEIEENNPIHSMIQDHQTGDLKSELLDERVLSAIIEMQVPRAQLQRILQMLKQVIPQLDSVFTLDVFTLLEENLQVPLDILSVIESEGFAWRPNAKINMGLGRVSE
ncbi:MAG: 4Fe-4S binding protein [Desulfobacterales bacterium]|nr:4Fe-4S binding protein [Desulfobacterales bacterium]